MLYFYSKEVDFRPLCLVPTMMLNIVLLQNYNILEV